MSNEPDLQNLQTFTESLDRWIQEGRGPDGFNYPILQHFSFKHLPQHLALVSIQFASIAREMIETVGVSGPEASAGLRKLLEAKDCFVRATIEETKKRAIA